MWAEESQVFYPSGWNRGWRRAEQTGQITEELGISPEDDREQRVTWSDQPFQKNILVENN